MAKLSLTLDMDEAAVSRLDELAAAMGCDRNGMVEQVLTEMLRFEPQEPDYDSWFRKEVEHALAESELPDAVFTPHEDVMVEMKTIIQERMNQAPRRAG